MAGKYSPGAMLKIAELESFSPQIMRLNTLVETYATAKSNVDSSLAPMKRTADQLRLKLMGVGLDNMAQLCGALGQAAARAGNQNAKARLLRELIGNLRFNADLAIRTIIREDEAAHPKKVGADYAKKETPASE